MPRRAWSLIRACAAVCLLLGAAAALAARPQLAIIIDDLGNLRAAGERVVALPGPVACAILPHTPHGAYLAARAASAGKEVLLHLPLQPVEGLLRTGLGAIDIDSTRLQLARIVAADLASVPGAVGVNSHMGSLLTRHPGHMGWLMGELKARGGLFFVDSYTTAASVALPIAREFGVPATRRDVFLDSDPAPERIDAEFRRLKALARERGAAVAIGHPYESTLRFLEEAVPRLAAEGFDLVPVGHLVSLGARSD